MGGVRLLFSISQLQKSLESLRRISSYSFCKHENLYTSYCYRYSRRQPLHYKILDKDAGMDAQRQANKLKQDYEWDTPDEERTMIEKASSSSRHRGLNIIEERKREGGENNDVANIVSEDTEQVSPENNDVFGNDPDVFGNSQTDEHDELDAGDVAEEEFIRNPKRRVNKLRTVEYARLIKDHLKSKRLKEAIDVLEVRMLKEDRAKPETYIYNLLISGCAKAGYTRKAFGLFTKMRQRGLKITGGTYTSLFNACANAPSDVDGLKQANHLRQIMLEKGYEPNSINYNAMIKAYGRCGDVKTAFMLVDEMKEHCLEINASTFNFLLQACASDKQFGFRHCLLTWHKMLRCQIVPDYYSFSAVLRCVRDCGLGDLSTINETLKQIFTEETLLGIAQPKKSDEEEEGVRKEDQLNVENVSIPHTESADTSEVVNGMNTGENRSEITTSELSPNGNDSIQLRTDSTALEIPNLLKARPHLGSMISISEISHPHERLLLLGGLTGFLATMKDYKITPDIECFTIMLEVIPPTIAAEKQLISFIRKIGLKADIDFFNILIKKRSMRFDYEGAKEVLNMIRTAGLKPDIVTYGVLALGCRTTEEARELLQIMRTNEIRLNIQILGAMLRQGCSQRAFPYVTEILQISLDENIKPNDVFLTHLHNFYNRCARAIDARHPYTKTISFKKGHKKFCEKMRLWYEEHGLSGLKLQDAIAKVKERPYAQYKEKSENGMEPLKNEKLIKRQKMRKYIKKIKLKNLKDDHAKINE